MFWIIIFIAVVLLGLVVAVYLMPTETAKSKKKKEKKPVLMPDPVDKTKDWKAIAERWEKHNQSLLGEIEKMKMDHKQDQQQMGEFKAKDKELVEKLALERSWREKEQASLEKLKRHEKDFKEQIQRTEADLEKEHSGRLRGERDLQEAKIKYDEIVEEKRQLSVKAMSLETTLKALNQELKELKSDNAKLKEKREDIQWVSKSEFDELKKDLQAKEQELTRLKQNPPSA